MFHEVLFQLLAYVFCQNQVSIKTQAFPQGFSAPMQHLRTFSTMPANRDCFGREGLMLIDRLASCRDGTLRAEHAPSRGLLSNDG